MPLDQSQAQDPQFDTPEMIDRKRLLALAMQKQGMDYSPVKSWTEGAARLADAFVGTLQQRRLDQQERGQNAAMMQALMPYLSSQGGMSPVPQPSAPQSPVSPQALAPTPAGPIEGGPSPSAYASDTYSVPGATKVTTDPRGPMFPGTGAPANLADGVANRVAQPQPPQPGQQPDPRALLAVAMSGGRLAPVASALLAKRFEPQYKEVPAGGSVIDLTTGKPIYTAPEKPEAGMRAIPGGGEEPIPGGSKDLKTIGAVSAARSQGALDALQNSPEAQNIADGIEQGKQPPTTTGLYRVGAGVRSLLAKRGVDLAKLDLQWDGAVKHINNLNSSQRISFMGLGTSLVNTIDEVKRLSNQLQQSGFTYANAAELEVKIKALGNTPQGQLATQYRNAVNTVKEEFAGLAQGGLTPTEPAWKLANEQINENYGFKQMDAALSESQRLVNFRMSAIANAPTLGIPDNPYAGKQEITPPGASGMPTEATSAKKLRYNPATGDLEPAQ